MTDHDDREPQRVLGIPVRSSGGRPFVGDTEPRVAGLPASWLSGPTVGLSWLRHPIRQAKSRRQVRGDGPYAPDPGDGSTS
jgi:hypothetical protein